MSSPDATPWPAEIQRVETLGAVRYVLPPRIESPGVFSAGCGLLFGIVPLAGAGIAIAALVEADWKQRVSILLTLVLAPVLLYFCYGGIRWIRSWLVEILPCGIEIICENDTLTWQTTLRGLRGRLSIRRKSIGTLTTQRLYPIEGMPLETRLVITRPGKKSMLLVENYPLPWLNAVAHDLARQLDPTGNLPVIELPMQTYEELTGNPEPESLATARKQILASQEERKP